MCPLLNFCSFPTSHDNRGDLNILNRLSAEVKKTSYCLQSRPAIFRALSRFSTPLILKGV